MQGLVDGMLVGTIVASTINLCITWWMLTGIENLDSLPPDNPWAFPKDGVAFDASVTWGLVGLKHLFSPLGSYKNLVWLFLVGAILSTIFAFSTGFGFARIVATLSHVILFNGRFLNLAKLYRWYISDAGSRMVLYGHQACSGEVFLLFLSSPSEMRVYRSLEVTDSMVGSDFAEYLQTF